MAYLTAAGIESCLQYLATTYSSICQLIMLPHNSHEGRTSRAIKLANGEGEDRRGVLFIGGCHAREIVNPDLLVSLALRICQAYTSNSGLTFGGKTFDASTIRLIVNALDIYIFPLVNPDGRVYVQSPTGNPMWRKNRNPNPGLTCIGVDLNRNYDFLWSSGIGTSSSSCSDIYKGTAAESEPEVKNVLHMLNTYSNIRCMIDVHSYSELLLFPWGDDENQSTNPAMNFLNPAYDGLRGTAGDGVYKEYIPPEDLDWFVDTGNDIKETIRDVRGRSYTVQQGIYLYPTTATGGDYPYSRHFSDTSKPKIHSFTLETGREFQPPYSEALNIINEGSAGLIQCCINCLCIVEEVTRSTTVAQRLSHFRAFRDSELLTSIVGRRYASMLRKNQFEILNLMMKDKELQDAGLALLRRVSKVALSKEPSKFNKRLINDIDDFAIQVSAKVSSQLQKAIAEGRQDMEHFRDRTISEALHVVQQYRHELQEKS